MPNRREDDLLIEYLARLRSALEGLPASEREDVYRELAQHVYALVEAEVHAGEDREATTQAALQKFGNPEKIGQKIVSDYWAQAFRQRQPKRRAYCLPEFLLPILSGVFAGLSVAIAHVFQYSGLALTLAATVWGSLLGIANGWQSARRKTRSGSERTQRTSALHWMRSHPALTVLIGVELLLFAIVGAVIFHAIEDSLHWTVSAPADKQTDRTQEFVLILLLSDAASTVFFRRFFLSRQSDGQADTGIGE